VAERKAAVIGSKHQETKMFVSVVMLVAARERKGRRSNASGLNDFGSENYEPPIDLGRS
jgi:hypothetical protein